MELTKELLLSNRSKKKIEKVSGIVIHFSPEFYDCKAAFQAYTKLKEINKEHKDYGFHYGLDQYDYVSYIPHDEQAINMLYGKPTYISSTLFNDKPEEHTISILICFSEEHDFEKLEKRLIELCSDLINKYELSKDNIWRAFDLNKSIAGPFHMLNNDIWNKFLNEVDKKSKSDLYVIKSPFESLLNIDNPSIHLAIKNTIVNGLQDKDKYVETFEPYDKNLSAIKNSPPINKSIETIDNPTESKLQFIITQDPPTTDAHCVKAVDKLIGILTPKNAIGEPIYPDLVVPPGQELYIANGFSEGQIQNSTDITLTAEEFEKRQKTFNIKDYDKASKVTTGRPINYKDPYPVDDRIEKLEEHHPKINVDKIKFKVEDDNHPNSEIGAALVKNLTMTYDMISDVARRAEVRVSRLENQLATVSRYLFRLSSRMNVNCVYYGGQSVYGKYKSIRCLHDNRINDGQVVTLDQCLNCTRYEPIIGQIYAILDDSGENIVKVIDDMQMSYMDMKEYSELSRIENFHTEKKYADLSNNPANEPKTLSEIWDEKAKNEENAKSFQMDWTLTNIDDQIPHVNKYDTEGIVAEKKILKSDNQQIDPSVYIDDELRTGTYENIIYDTDNYIINRFGTVSQGNNDLYGGIFGNGTTEVREKIVNYAKQALDLCKENKAGYSQEKRYNHLDKAINGISYWDCSSLVQKAYESAGIINIGTYTGNMYPTNLPRANGMIFTSSEIEKAIPGDIVWFTNQRPLPNNSVEELTKANLDTSLGIYHVGIYIGDGEYIHASSGKGPLNQQIKQSKLSQNKDFFSFGRPKLLVELDKEADSILSTSELFDPDKQKLPNDLRDSIYNKALGWVNSLKAYNNQWNYGKYFLQASKEMSKELGITVDPYMMLAMSAVESGGNPNAGGPDPGLMQLAIGSGGKKIPTGLQPNTPQADEYFLSQIKGSIKHLNTKRIDISKMAGESFNSWPYAIYGYNSGQGTVAFTIKKYKLSSMTAGEFAHYIKQYVQETNIIPYPQVRYEYFARVLWCYNLLKKDKVLG